MIILLLILLTIIFVYKYLLYFKERYSEDRNISSIEKDYVSALNCCYAGSSDYHVPKYYAGFGPSVAWNL